MLLCPNPECGDIGESTVCTSCGFKRVPMPVEANTNAGIDDDKSAFHEELIKTQRLYEISGPKINKQLLQPDFCHFCECFIETGSRFCHKCGEKAQWTGITDIVSNTADDIKRLSLDRETKTVCTNMAETSKSFQNSMLLCPNPKCGDIGESKFCTSCRYQRVPIPEVPSTGAGTDDNKSASSEELIKTQRFYETSGVNVNKQRLKPDTCNFCECVLETGTRFCQKCGEKVQFSESTGNVNNTADDIKRLSLDRETKTVYTNMAETSKSFHNSMLLCPNPKCGDIGESKFCTSCRYQRVPIPEVPSTGAGTDDNKSASSEELIKTQRFYETSGVNVDKQRLKPDTCNFCECVLETGSRFCHKCGEKVQFSESTGTKRKAADNLNKSNLYGETGTTYTTMAGACNIIPEPTEPSEKDANSGPGLSAKEKKRMEDAAQGGVSKLKEYLQARNNVWKHIPLHIAVTGSSGVGKSSFINALRGIKKGQKGFAEVDVTETTTELKGYPHPLNKSLVFWDMPGVGTPKFLRNDYLKAVGFEKYDFFLILTCGRFTENDLWLASQVRTQKNTFYFIRTKIGFDVYNARRNDSKTQERDIVAQIRDDCIGKLKAAEFKDPSVFLIDNNDIAKYDFGMLVDTLLKQLPEKKREALALSLTVMTKEVILAKRYALRKRIFVISFASALGGAVPLPGLGAAIDTAIILEEKEEYKRQFGLTDDALLKHNPKYAQMIKDKYVQNISQVAAAITIDEAAKNAVKFGIPILGSILSGTVSYGVTVTMLWRLLNSMADDALRLNEDIITGLSSDTDV